MFFEFFTIMIALGGNQFVLQGKPFTALSAGVLYDVL